eukprot:TRINITY_DN101_c2_g1_i2.p1 TRINITY_DN101_c2_g1~~TRINITY_DN101_c2_g1_i2.p1  ORF type:complete len:410 (-),score=173.15 TRINITY_DN101_c2_g1_i2:101-1258(-)
MLESVMICCDNSEHARNGDYYPTRHDAQVDAVHMIVGAKLNSNAESAVGFLTMAGRSPTVHVTPTRDDTKILAKLHKVPIGGTSDFIAGARIASLALKHRSNKVQHPRLIMFVASPVEVEEKDLKKLAKDLRKNGVAVDIISIGENEANDELLQDFLKKIDEETCNFLSVAPGKDVCDSLRGTGILYDFDTGGNGGGAGGFGGGMDVEGIGGVNDFSEYGGIDPSVDPELANVMRQSILDQQAQLAKMEEEAVKASLAENGNGDAMDTETTDGTDAQLQAALGATTTTTTTSSNNNDDEDDEDDDDEDEDDENEAMQRALQISLGLAGDSTEAGGDDDDEEEDEDDPEFMAGILANLPGIDKDSDKFKGILDDVKKDKKDEEKDE